MTSLRPFTALDLFKCNLINLDSLTENYDISFYLSYLAQWPSLFTVVEGRRPVGRMMQSEPDIEGAATATAGDSSSSASLGSGSDSAAYTSVRLAYIMAKLESSPSRFRNTEYYVPWHAHITALSVAPPARRQGLARLLSQSLERAGNQHDAWFVDLYVRKSNNVAIGLYRSMGYNVFRKVVSYYDDDEDAYDMRKPLKRDVGLKHIRENGEDHEVLPENVF